jgi:hypothetical protein
MLLFSDGFDSYSIYDLRLKWGFFGIELPYPSYEPLCKIVTGTDLSTNQPWATKNGRALYISQLGATLATFFKPSRTLYAGFAFRSTGTGTCTMVMKFGTRMSIDRGTGYAYHRTGSHELCQNRQDIIPDGANTAASLTISISKHYTSYTWAFAGGQTVVGSINTTMNMMSGDYHYIQFGMTLMGNITAQPMAWAEIRIGSNPVNWSLDQNILTSTPDGLGTFFLNGLSISFNVNRSGAYPTYVTVDDFYLCNDEGAVNNGFLGNVKVRRVLPTAEGQDNDAVPVLKTGDSARFQAVDEDFIGSTALPYPLPTPEQDPSFIPWTRFDDDYITLPRRGAKQSFRFQSVEFSGSQPHLFGAVLHGLARSAERGVSGASCLKGYKRTGLAEVREAAPTDVPLTFERSLDYCPMISGEAIYVARSWQTYPMVFQNDEVVAPGQMPLIWNPSAINASEWGIELADCTLDPVMYDVNLVRFKLINDETCVEALGFVEFVHRFYDCSVAETISSVDSPPLYERTFKVVESLYWAPEISLYRIFNKSVNSTLDLEEEIPWIFMFTQGQIEFSDAIFLEWQDLVAESLTTDDWSTGFWEELTTETVIAEDTTAIAFIERLEELFGLEEPYVWDGHEDVEEELGIDVSYVWDGHELMEEYLYPNDAVRNGFGLDIEEEFGFIEEHFDGWLVELFDEPISFGDSVLTQHWRYERFFGIVINSWQIDPVEQQGQDGNHDGDNPLGW